MNKFSLDPRYRVVLKLQNLLKNSKIASETADIAEHAIDLALNPTRQAENASYLLRNVWRDASKILRRRDANNPSISLNVEPLIDGLACYPHSFLRLVDNTTPEALAITNQIEEKLKGAMAAIAPYANRCLEGMIAGETLQETATATGQTTRRIRRLRQRIRLIAEKLLGRPA